MCLLPDAGCFAAPLFAPTDSPPLLTVQETLQHTHTHTRTLHFTAAHLNVVCHSCALLPSLPQPSFRYRYIHHLSQTRALRQYYDKSQSICLIWKYIPEGIINVIFIPDWIRINLNYALYAPLGILWHNIYMCRVIKYFFDLNFLYFIEVLFLFILFYHM